MFHIHPFRRIPVLLIAAAALLVEPAGSGTHAALGGAALADDGDGGEGGEGGDDGGGSSHGGTGGGAGGGIGIGGGGIGRGLPRVRVPGLRSIVRGLRSPFSRNRGRAASRAAAPPPQPILAEREIVAAGLTEDHLAQLAGLGYDVLARDTLAALGGAIVRLDPPADLDMDAARLQVASLAPEAAIDFNHFYRPEQAEDAPAACSGRHCIAPALVGWPAGETAPAARCMASIRIGLIDTAINVEHDAFEDGQIETIRIEAGETPESGRQHGTSIASLLVGRADGPFPGLLPGARLIAADPFSRDAGGDVSDAFNLVRALDAVAGREADVVNLSLAGPPNLLLERMVSRLAERGAVLVAAAGNDGPRAEPAYPAGYASVVAVTAVDRRKRVYRGAVRGGHIDIAAPGVSVWTAASISGARPKTGTSYAAPFVTAAAVMLKSSGLDREAIAERLARDAEDLGEPGRDDIFGWGLLDASGIACAGAAEAAADPAIAPAAVE